MKEININLSDQVLPILHPLFEDEYANVIITSGRAGAKSSGGAIAANFRMISKPCAVIGMRKHHNKLNPTIYKESIRAIGRLGLSKSKDFKITKKPMEIKYLDNGSTMYFAGSDGADDTKGIIDEDYPIELVQIDEVSEFFKMGLAQGKEELANVRATFARGNDEGFQTQYFFNPPKNPKDPVMEWLEEMKKRTDTIHIHITYLDVPKHWVGKALLNEAEQTKAVDDEMYRHIWLGECVGVNDLIYYMFEESRHVKKYADERLQYLGIGVDYGQQNATTFQAFGVDVKNKRVQGVGEYLHSGRISGRQRTPSEYARHFKEFVEEIEKLTNQTVGFCVIDPSARGLAEEIKRVIPRVKVIAADNSVELGISRVQKLLAFDALKLDPSQKELIAEESLYAYDQKSIDRGVEKPLKINDHAQDAKRYYVMAIYKHMARLLPQLKEKE